jgi:hypothetical protein
MPAPRKTTVRPKRKGLASAYGRPSKETTLTATKPSQDRSKLKKILCDKLCSTCDPLCTNACGSKLMGQTSSRTFSYTHKQIVTVPSNGSGENAQWFQPGIGGCEAYPTGIAGGIVTWNTAGDIPEAAALRNSATQYRVVSACVRIFTIASPTNSSGRVQVSAVSEHNSVAPVGFDIKSQLYEEIYTDSVYEFDMTFNFRREGTEVANFISTSGTPAHPGWNGFVISLDGCPVNTPMVQVEITYNFELQPDPLTIYARLADKPARHVPPVEAAMANVQRGLPMGGPSESWSKTIMNFVGTEAQALLNSFTTAEILAFLV